MSDALDPPRLLRSFAYHPKMGRYADLHNHLLGGVAQMTIRTHKIVSLTLVILVVLLAWKCFTFYGHIVNANFVGVQAADLRATVRAANDGWTGSESVLNSLDWYIRYYDHRTNSLAGSGLLQLLREDRERTVTEAITYLRNHGTNDFGDDPYKWLQKEHGR